MSTSNLNPAQELIINSIKNGVLADCTTISHEMLSVPANWFAETITSLGGNEKMSVRGVRVEGDSNWSGTTISSIYMVECDFSGSLSIHDSIFSRTLGFNQCTFQNILATRSLFHNQLVIQGCRIDEFLDISEINCRASVVLNNSMMGEASAVIQTKSRPTLIGSRLVAASGFSMTGAKIFGNATLIGATIGGQLALHNSEFRNPGGNSLVLAESKIQGGIYLRNIKSDGGIILNDASIHGGVAMSGADLRNENGESLSARNLQCSGGIQLTSEFTSMGTVTFDNATVGGNFEIDGTIRGTTTALSLARARVRSHFRIWGESTIVGSLNLEGINIEGDFLLMADFNSELVDNKTALNLQSSSIGGHFQLWCEKPVHGVIDISHSRLAENVSFGDTVCRNANGISVILDHTEIASNLVCYGEFLGGLRGRYMRIGGDIHCSGATFSGKSDGEKLSSALNLRGSTITGSIHLMNDFMAKGTVDISLTQIRGEVYAQGGHFDGNGEDAIKMTGSVVEGEVLFCNSFRSIGPVNMAGSTIKKDLNCYKASFLNPGGVSLNFQNANVFGSVKLTNGFSSEGSVVGRDCSVGLFFDATGASFTEPDLEYGCLAMDRARIGNGVFLRGPLKADGKINFSSTTIGGDFSCTGGKFGDDSDDDVLTIYGAVVSGDLRFDFSEVRGCLFIAASKCRSLILNGATIYSNDQWSLMADGIMASQDIKMTGKFSSFGTISFGGASVGGQVEISGGFDSSNLTVLDFANAEIGRTVHFMRGFVSNGCVRFDNCAIQGSLIFEGAQLLQSSSKYPAGNIPLGSVPSLVLSAERLRVAARMSFGPEGNSGTCRIDGSISLHNATIGANLSFEGVAFSDTAEVNLEGACVAKELFWRDLTSLPDFVSLRSCSVEQLCDDASAWGLMESQAKEVKVDLVGFEYSQFGSSTAESGGAGVGELDVRQRISWIGSQTHVRGNYVPQPYQQLANVYQLTGRDGERRKVLIAQQDDFYRFGSMNRSSRYWNRFMAISSKHGYQPLRPFLFTVMLYLLAIITVSLAQSHNAMVPTQFSPTAWNIDSGSVDAKGMPKSRVCQEDYPCLNSWLYSFDSLIPVIDLNQTPYWAFDMTSTLGLCSSWLFSLTIIFGWISSSFYILIMTGLIKRD